MVLLLGNHVNRPAYVVPCIAEALSQAGLTSSGWPSNKNVIRQISDDPCPKTRGTNYRISYQRDDFR